MGRRFEYTDAVMFDKTNMARGALLLSLLLAFGCGTAGEGPGIDDLYVSAWGPPVVLQGTAVEFDGAGFIPAQLGEMTLRLEGTCGEAKITHAAQLEYVSDTSARWVVDETFFAAAGLYDEPFVGTATIRRTVTGYSGFDSVTLQVSLSLRKSLTPQLLAVTPDGAFVGDELQVQGADLLLPGEGQSLLVLSGEYDVASPPMTKSLSGVVIPLAVESRSRASFTLTPDKFGIYPGHFTGEALVANYANFGEATESAALEGLALHVYPPELESFTPEVVRRGQRVWIAGRGFVPTDPAGESATLLLLEGLFQTDAGKEISYQGNKAMLLFPESLTDNRTMEVVLRVSVGVDGNLTGLGLVPGVFTGTAYPELFFGSESVRGSGLDFTLTIAPQLQVVYVKFLPSFDEAFHKFGLHPVKEQIKTRIVARANSHYTAFNVTFTAERPEDFAEYSIIELSGQDPNGASLLGLDNTTGKDNYNVRFNDVVGGKNAETEEQGYYAYGGVFLESFLMFSPVLSNGGTSLASPRFDDVFSPFVAGLGGTPLTEEEVASGARKPLVDEAIRVLGNALGGTVAHEIGHSLGLAMVPGHPEEYHNLGDNPAWLMDAGTHRPFVERAELDGEGPEVFAPYNFDYLSEILPKG